MMHIVLIGDSILDNASYVDENDSIVDLLKNQIPNCKVTLLAVDGSMTSDIEKQLAHFPDDATHVFFSCGGNDGLDNVDVLNEKVFKVEEGLEKLSERIESFRYRYKAALTAVCAQCDHVAVFTIYNKVPGVSVRLRTALALFNEVIIEEVASKQLPLIDLRVIFNEEQDFSPLSPIEPSVYGGRKIASRMETLIKAEFSHGMYV